MSDPKVRFTADEVVWFVIKGEKRDSKGAVEDHY